jgi:diguanylate cyclase (GGDEF)-like protein/PAS domain S-box-containing protein
MNQSSNDDLRQIAKTRLQSKVTQSFELQVENVHKLLHELQVHQIELEMQNEALREARDAEDRALYRYTEIFDFAPVGYFILDRNSTITQVNLRGANMLGLERLKLTERRFLIFVTQEHRIKFSGCLAKAFDTGDKQNFEILVQVGKHALWFSLEANAGATGTGCLVAMTDITERKLAEDKLKRIAHFDLLTDLPNRVLLADRLSQAMLQCQPRKRSVAVAYLDLDGFKTVNDSYGHDMGDKLLVALSQRIKEALGQGDTLARVGGDEFIAVMVDLENIKDNNLVLEKLLKAAADPVTVGDTVLHVTASIGVTLYPQDGADTDQLIRHADQAMYIAKQAGKNRYHLFDPILDMKIKFQQESINDIRSALIRNEFVLHYQPKVNMHTGEVIGLEALIRWQHPERGLVPPLEFLPVIEGHVISLKLGEWVIDTALTQISQWGSKGEKLSISVNISAYQLQQVNFAARLEALLAVHPEVNPNSLELEVLETSALNDIDQVLDTMNACHKLEVGFALDDFGTGYSSLTYLRRLPAYLIKIDQSFVRNMLEDADDLAIVEGVIGLAKAFQREVIAEGVETIEHGVALWQLGCELAQGYGIARPMPAGDIPEWVSNWKANDSKQLRSLIEAKTT